MPRYFLDFDTNGTITKDDTGTKFASVEEMRREARHTLSAIGRDDIGTDGETMTYKVLVFDEQRHPVYSVTMTLVGTTISGNDAL